MRLWPKFFPLQFTIVLKAFIARRSGISKHMVCQTYGMHACRLSQKRKRRKSRKRRSNSYNYKQGVECWICRNHGNHGNDENHGNLGCKPRVPQTTGLEIPEKKAHVLTFISHLVETKANRAVHAHSVFFLRMP